jgi:serine/threonine protein kinase
LKQDVERLPSAVPSGEGILDLPVEELPPESLAALTPSRLGPYAIVSKIGEGGMGEVWKARDSRLNRDGAIKISVRE